MIAGVSLFDVYEGENVAAGTKSLGIEVVFQPRERTLTDQEIDHPEWRHYGMYYAAMGIYQAQSLGAQGERWWSTWYPAAVRDLLDRQQPDGHWKGNWEAYDTSMAILILTIPYRYLPIYQR